jgi:hypothetical protein
MRCVYYRGETRCQRCERNSEKVCVFQRQDLTKPPAPPTRYEQDRLQLEAALAREPDHPWLRGWLQLMEPRERREPPLQCMVYSRDPDLCGGGGGGGGEGEAGRRRRLLLLETAADMLAAAEARTTTYVHGQAVTAADARNFVLPSWQEEGAHNWRRKWDPRPEFRQRAAFDEGVAAEQAAASAGARQVSPGRTRPGEHSDDKWRRAREEWAEWEARHRAQVEAEAGEAAEW